MERRKKFNWLVVDSSGFINCSDIHELTNNIITIPDVIGEIKDKTTRERLSSLPYQIQFREPSPDDIKVISQFSKKTGDYGSLSVVDVKLMALTYLLDREAHNGKTDHLNKDPVVKVIGNESVKSDINAPIVKLPGFYAPKRKDGQSRGISTSECSHEMEANNDQSKKINNDIADQSHTNQQNEIVSENKDEDAINKEHNQDQHNLEDTNSNQKTDDTNQIEESGEDEEEEEEEEDDDDDDNEDTWITPKNLREMEEKMKQMLLEEEQCSVACMTSDYAIQNVLIQMGLKVASVKGLLIKKTKQFVLRCHACFKITSEMDRKFCPKCGNLGTLKRVSVHVNEKGEKTIQINFRKPINIRGMRYSLPMPKGGKHANDPILVEDQRIPQNKSSKLTYMEKKALNCSTILSDPDYVVRSSPFAVKDVYSRASRFSRSSKLAYVDRRRNPNEVGHPTGNKKKKSKAKI